MCSAFISKHVKQSMGWRYHGLSCVLVFDPHHLAQRIGQICKVVPPCFLVYNLRYRYLHHQPWSSYKASSQTQSHDILFSRFRKSSKISITIIIHNKLLVIHRSVEIFQPVLRRRSTIVWKSEGRRPTSPRKVSKVKTSVRAQVRAWFDPWIIPSNIWLMLVHIWLING